MVVYGSNKRKRNRLPTTMSLRGLLCKPWQSPGTTHRLCCAERDASNCFSFIETYPMTVSACREIAPQEYFRGLRPWAPRRFAPRNDSGSRCLAASIQQFAKLEFIEVFYCRSRRPWLSQWERQDGFAANNLPKSSLFNTSTNGWILRD